MTSTICPKIKFVQAFVAFTLRQLPFLWPSFWNDLKRNTLSICGNSNGHDPEWIFRRGTIQKYCYFTFHYTNVTNFEIQHAIHLVTSEDSSPVMVVLRRGSRSCCPCGIFMGNWARSNSTFLICCLFCHINSARFSHLHLKPRTRKLTTKNILQKEAFSTSEYFTNLTQNVHRY